MEGSEISILELIKSVDSGFYYLMVAIMILAVLTFVVSLYSAIRMDRLWSIIKRQHDIAEIKKEVKADLKSI